MTWHLGRFHQRSVHDSLDQYFRFQAQRHDRIGFWTIVAAAVMVSPLLMFFKFFASGPCHAVNVLIAHGPLPM